MSDDAIVKTDARGAIQFWNEAATTLFGYDSKEALGQSLDIIVGEDFREAYWSSFRAAVDNGTSKLEGVYLLSCLQHSRMELSAQYQLVLSSCEILMMKSLRLSPFF